MDKKPIMPPNPRRHPKVDPTTPPRRQVEESAPMAPDVETVFQLPRIPKTPRLPRF